MSAMLKVWSVVVRPESGEGTAVSFEGEQEFLDKNLAYKVFDKMCYEFGFQDINPRGKNDDDVARNVYAAVIGKRDGDTEYMHIELRVELQPAVWMPTEGVR